MEFEMTQYEVKYLYKEEWEDISEGTVLINLLDSFNPITPILSEMVRGKEIVTSQAIYRMKICGNEGKDF